MKRILGALLVFAFGAAFAAVAEEPNWVRENELVLSDDLGRRGETQEAVCDLRTAFTAATLEDDPALQGLMYSAIGWELDAAADSSRTVAISAVPGALVDGAFVSSGSPISVLVATPGRGSCDWQMTTAEKKLYQLTHTVRNGSAVDAMGTLVGYIDFSHVASRASQGDVEAAVLGERTQSLTVAQDVTWPWQPIGTPAALSGICTDSVLDKGLTTATAFSFKGVGTFTYEYALDGGQLTIIVDGVGMALAATAGAWMPGTVEFGTSGEHVVEFAYVASGGGLTAALRSVRRDSPDLTALASGESAETRVDFQSGEVRTPRQLAWVLPFVYSPTNFIGTVDGTAARVSIVRLEGDDPDVTQWTEVGTPRVLKKSSDEGEVVWRAKKGVWKAVFEFYDGDKLLERETQTKIFDLRNATGSGTVIFVT